MQQTLLSKTSSVRRLSTWNKLYLAQTWLLKSYSSGRHSPQQSPDLARLKQRLREWSENTLTVARRQADDFTAKTSSGISRLGLHLNRVTGYEEIEALKLRVAEHEVQIMATRQAARDAKASYAAAVMQRSNSQREVNDLLQRKSLWTDGDVGRFTTIVRQDHLYEQEEARTKASVDETEAAVEREFSELMRSILARYHEEQVWSDKIRSASTYGSLAALGLNLVVFLLAIVVVEPWKRRRLAMTFEERVTEMAAENKAMIHEGVTTLLKQMKEQGSLFNERLDSVMEHTPDTSRTVGVSTSASSVEREAKVARDREIGIAVAASVMIAGAIGWVAHGLVRL